MCKYVYVLIVYKFIIHTMSNIFLIFVKHFQKIKKIPFKIIKCAIVGNFVKKSLLFFKNWTSIPVFTEVRWPD